MTADEYIFFDDCAVPDVRIADISSLILVRQLTLNTTASCGKKQYWRHGPYQRIIPSWSPERRLRTLTMRVLTSAHRSAQTRAFHGA